MHVITILYVYKEISSLHYVAKSFFFHVHVLPRVLFKKDNPSFETNYWAVPLLSFISKTMERIIFNYIICYRYQAGVLSGHSSVCQFLETYPIIVKYK